MLVPYKRYVCLMKWRTLALLVYVTTASFIQIPLTQIQVNALMPQMSSKSEYVTTDAAIFGKKISPYHVCWQASQGVEDQLAAPTLCSQTIFELRRRFIHLFKLPISGSFSYGLSFQYLTIKQP